MIIYRLETLLGNGKSTGPFDFGGYLSDLIQNFFTYKSHPCPWNDGIPSMGADFRLFGCPSFALLKYWMVATPEKRRHVLDHYESHEHPDEVLKMVKGSNRRVLDILRSNEFVIGRYEVPEDHCHIGKMGTQVAFDHRYTIDRTEHRVEALFRGALM